MFTHKQSFVEVGAYSNNKEFANKLNYRPQQKKSIINY